MIERARHTLSNRLVVGALDCDVVAHELAQRLSLDQRPPLLPETQAGAQENHHRHDHGGVEIARVSGKQLHALPQFRDVLIGYQERAFLDIELKVFGLEKITVALLQKHLPRRGFVVSSFLPEVVQAVHAQDSGVPLGLICETEAELRAWNQLPIEYVIPQFKLVDQALLRQLRDARRKILVWTVNAPAEMQHFAESGVDGIISDDTSLLYRTLGV